MRIYPEIKTEERSNEKAYIEMRLSTNIRYKDSRGNWRLRPVSFTAENPHKDNIEAPMLKHFHYMVYIELATIHKKSKDILDDNQETEKSRLKKLLKQ